MESLHTPPLPDELAADNRAALEAAVRKQFPEAEKLALQQSEEFGDGRYGFVLQASDGQRYNVTASLRPDGSLGDLSCSRSFNVLTDEI